MSTIVGIRLKNREIWVFFIFKNNDLKKIYKDKKNKTTKKYYIAFIDSFFKGEGTCYLFPTFFHHNPDYGPSARSLHHKRAKVPERCAKVKLDTACNKDVYWNSLYLPVLWIRIQRLRGFSSPGSGKKPGSLEIHFILIWIRILEYVSWNNRSRSGSCSESDLKSRKKKICFTFFYYKYISPKNYLFCYMWGKYLCPLNLCLIYKKNVSDWPEWDGSGSETLIGTMIFSYFFIKDINIF